MFESCRAHFREKCCALSTGGCLHVIWVGGAGRSTRLRSGRASVAAGISLVEPTVQEVDRQRDTECEEHADPPPGRMVAAALVCVHEDEDRDRCVDRPGNEKRSSRQRGVEEHSDTLAGFCPNQAATRAASTESASPYATASSGDRKLSLSMSFRTCSFD